MGLMLIKWHTSLLHATDYMAFIFSWPGFGTNDHLIDLTVWMHLKWDQVWGARNLSIIPYVPRWSLGQSRAHMGFIFLFCLYFYFLLKTRIQTISALSDTRVDPTSQRAELTIMRLFKMGHATDRKTCQGVNISKRYLRCKHYSYVYFF